MAKRVLSEEHRRKLSEAAKRRSPEAEARRVAALREAKRREDPSYRHTPEYRARQSQVTKKRWDAGDFDDRAEKTAATRASWTDEQRAEVSRTMSEAKRKEWAEKGPGRNSVPGHLRHKVSKAEHALAPYLATMGFKHNDKAEFWIGRKVPDFYDEDRRLVVEYFGSFFHTPDQEQILVDYYQEQGWGCRVLWENDLPWFLTKFAYRVSSDQYRESWKLARLGPLPEQTEATGGPLWPPSDPVSA